MKQALLALVVLVLSPSVRADEQQPAVDEATPTPVPTLHALAPEAIKIIGPMFDRLKPALPFSEVSINIDRVHARLCPAGKGDEACFPLNLYHRDHSCGGSIWGPFCVEFPAGAPPPESADLIEKAAKATDGTDLWTSVYPTPGPETPTPTPTEPMPAAAAPLTTDAAPEGDTTMVAVGLVLAALAGGVMLWLAMRRGRS